MAIHTDVGDCGRNEKQAEHSPKGEQGREREKKQTLTWDGTNMAEHDGVEIRSKSKEKPEVSWRKAL